MCDSSVHSKMWTKMWLKAVYATAFIAFEVALVKMSLAASIHDCWNPEKLNRMKFPVSQRETFFAFFTLYIIYMYYYQLPNYHLLLSSTFISCWNWHNKNQLSLVFRFSSFDLELGFFLCTINVLLVRSLKWSRLPSWIGIGSPFPDHASNWSRYYLLKFVTCPRCVISKRISFEKGNRT